jgi:hypothetical protein
MNEHNEPLELSARSASPTNPAAFPGAADQWQRAWERWRGKAWTFIALGVLTPLPLALLAESWRGLVGGDVWSWDLKAPASLTVALILLAAAGYWAGALLTATAGAAALRGNLRSLAWSIFTRAGLALLTASLAACAVLAGLVGLIAPGIWLGGRLTLLGPVMLTERRWLVAAMHRSAYLARRHADRLIAQTLAVIAVAALGVGVGYGVTAGLDRLLAASHPQLAALTLPALRLVLWSGVGVVALQALAAYWQIFYEDAVREKGTAWHPRPGSRRPLYLVTLLGISLAASAVAAFVLTYNQTETAPPPGPTVAEPIQAAPAAAPAQASPDLKRYEQLNLIRIALSEAFSVSRRYPEALADLVPHQLAAEPLDQETGAPYDYRRIDQDYLIRFTMAEAVFGLSPGAHTMTAGGFDVPLSVTPSLEPTQPTVQVIPGDELTTGSEAVAPPATVAPLFPESPSAQPAAPPRPVPTPTATTPATTAAPEPAEEPRVDPPIAAPNGQASADTDGDGLIDLDETSVWNTDPLVADTDGDGYDDGTEVRGGYNPRGPGRL